MFHVALYEPEIPPNTGNIIRLCANTGVELHLIHPLGFAPDDRQLRRAGLDYHAWARIYQHQNYSAFIKQLKPARLFACSTRGRCSYADVRYQPDDVFLFGPETRGLPQALLDTFSSENVIHIPMLSSSRSLNLSNAVSVVIYEAWRQFGFISKS